MESVDSLLGSEHWFYDQNTDQEAFKYEFIATFKESSYLNRSVYYSVLLYWTGKLRELALAEIGKSLEADFLSGDWGMVTNWAELEVFANIPGYCRVHGEFRIGEIHGSVIPLECVFYLMEGDRRIELARVTQETTW